MLDQRPDEFDQRNLFLQAVLGLVSVSRRLDAALAPQSVAAEAVAPDDPWLLCVVGMVALRERVMAAVGGVAATRAANHAPPAGTRSAVREILR
jgi:hypothetical protein